MNLRTRMVLGIVAIATILLIPLIIALRSIEDAHQITQGLGNNEFAASLLLGSVRESVDELKRAEVALVFVHNAQSKERFMAQLDTLGTYADSLKQLHLNTNAIQIQSSISAVRAAADSAYANAIAGRTMTADSISSKSIRPAIGNIEDAIGRSERTLSIRTRNLVNETSVTTANAQTLAATALAVALGLAALIAFLLTRATSRPVYELRTGMAAVAEGDLTYKLAISPERRDEFGQLADSFGAMTAQLRHLEKLRAEFISVASHELKTPINVIIGYVELLQEGIYGQLNEKQSEICDILTKQGQSLTRLVKHLLDISKFEAGGGKIEPKKASLRKFMKRLETSFHVLAMQRSIDFSVSCTDDISDEVIWDEDRMNEVLGNLVSNAFKFTERGGHVELTAKRENDQMRLEICDTGAGIPEDQLPHIFQKFFQADNQESASAEGTGLGLAIAKQIVEAHQGTISVDSTVGMGTTFTIILPMQSVGRTTGQFAIPGRKTHAAS